LSSCWHRLVNDVTRRDCCRCGHRDSQLPGDPNFSEIKSPASMQN
jgi:Zn ribbon nucleic-acid-binding protein